MSITAPHAGPRKATPTSYALEILLGLGLLCAVNFYFFADQPAFFRTAPHPYWLVVLPVAARYGFFGGLWSGLAAGGLYFALRAFAIPDVSLMELSAFSIWGPPLFFVTGGVVLGEIRQVQIRRQLELAVERDDAKKALDRLENQYRTLAEAKQEIDTRIISQEQTVSTLYESAQSLRSLNEEDIYPSVLVLLRDHVGVQAGRIYMIEGEELVLKARMGETPSPAPERTPKTQGVFGRVLSTGLAVALNEILDGQGAMRDTLICAPIREPEQNAVIGILCIDQMPFLKLNNETVKVVSLMADWCGSSLSNARLHSETRAKLITDDIIEAYTAEYLDRRLGEEFSRSRRYKLPLSLLLLAPPTCNGDGPPDEVMISMSLAVKEVIRNIDLLFLHPNPGWFALLLPNTPEEGARIVARKIGEKYDALMLRHDDSAEAGALHIGVASFAEGQEAPADMLALAETRACGLGNA